MNVLKCQLCQARCVMSLLSRIGSYLTSVLSLATHIHESLHVAPISNLQLACPFRYTKTFRTFESGSLRSANSTSSQCCQSSLSKRTCSMHPRPPPPNFSQKPAQPPPDTPLPSFGLYDILLENIQFDRESGVHESIHDLLHSPGPLGMKARRILPHLMPVMIRLEKLTLLNLLLQNDVAIAPEAVRAAAE